MRALVQVWSDERVCRQLESSTRKRDIFVQISNRLMQQGIERDWKQCHTKYKNLKYLYRSLQRGKTDEADPRRLMRFYDEVDAIMNRTINGSPHDTADHQDSGRLTMLEGCEENDHVDVYLTKMNTAAAVAGAMEDRTCSSDSVSSISLDVPPNSEEPRPHIVQELRLDQQHRLMSEPNVIIYSCLVGRFLMRRIHISYQNPSTKPTKIHSSQNIQALFCFVCCHQFMYTIQRLDHLI